MVVGWLSQIMVAWRGRVGAAERRAEEEPETIRRIPETICWARRRTVLEPETWLPAVGEASRPVASVVLCAGVTSPWLVEPACCAQPCSVEDISRFGDGWSLNSVVTAGGLSRSTGSVAGGIGASTAHKRCYNLTKL